MHAEYVVEIGDGFGVEDDVSDAGDVLLLYLVHDPCGNGKGAGDNTQDLSLAAALLYKPETENTGSRFDPMSWVICG